MTVEWNFLFNACDTGTFFDKKYFQYQKHLKTNFVEVTKVESAYNKETPWSILQRIPIAFPDKNIAIVYKNFENIRNLKTTSPLLFIFSQLYFTLKMCIEFDFLIKYKEKENAIHFTDRNKIYQELKKKTLDFNNIENIVIKSSMHPIENKKINLIILFEEHCKNNIMMKMDIVNYVHICKHNQNVLCEESYPSNPCKFKNYNVLNLLRKYIEQESEFRKRACTIGCSWVKGVIERTSSFAYPSKTKTIETINEYINKTNSLKLKKKEEKNYNYMNEISYILRYILSEYHFFRFRNTYLMSDFEEIQTRWINYYNSNPFSKVLEEIPHEFK